MSKAKEILKQHWGYDSFRYPQDEIIDTVNRSEDVLALLPTGGGKSICFQVPALMKSGLTLVISPLIALMRDQVMQLNQRSIKAYAIYSGLSHQEIDLILDNCIHSEVKFLYVSPERLKTDLFLERFNQMEINQIAVDEAHCISQWGYDFRPAYLEIAKIRTLKPEISVTALTATATPRVVEDIMEQLAFRKKKVIRKSFLRPNLSYVVRKTDGKWTKTTDVLNAISGSAVIYARNRKTTRDLANHLSGLKLSANYYHAGLKMDTRAERQHRWTSGKDKIIVATNAFGMGIDKPDVRSVIHVDLCESLEAYFQEAGRAGRDGNKAFAVALYQTKDIKQLAFAMEEHYPSAMETVQIYQALGNYYQLASGGGQFQSFDFSIRDFCQKFDFGLMKVHHAIGFLSDAGLLNVTENLLIPSKVKILVSNKVIYKFQVENKKFEALLKLLIRGHAGIFDEFVRVDEKRIARKTKLTEREIIGQLEGLSRNKLLHYIGQKDKPQLMFIDGRLKSDQIALDEDFINWRKEIYQKKLLAVIDYMTNNKICRSKKLLAYFGEKLEKSCGICDICLEQTKQDLSEEKFEQIVHFIEIQLSKAPIGIEELLKQSSFAKNDMQSVLKWMLDNELLKRTKGEKLGING